MRKILIYFFLQLFLVANSFGQFKNLIPRNWKITNQAEGDFNKDKIKDFIIIIDSIDNKDNWIVIKREILILHGNQKGLYKKSKNALIFSDRNLMVEPNMIFITAKENIIRIGIGDINFGQGNGAINYIIRYQNQEWFVIGCGYRREWFDHNDKEEPDMIGEIFSFNFVTQTSEITNKINNKIIKKSLTKNPIKLPRFKDFRGECY